MALVAALAGSAVALPGKNKVDKNDIKKGAVTKKAFKKGAVNSKAIGDGQVGAVDIAAGVIPPIPNVTPPDGSINTAKLADGAVNSAKLADGSVNSAKIADGQVGAADLTDPEPFRNVGASGQPPFGNGGEGDCIWSNATAIPGLNPTSFYKDPMGIVHLAGIAQAVDGPGGDGACDDTEDAFVYTLPPGYRPANIEIQGVSGGEVLIIGDQGITVGAQTIPPGTVAAAGGTQIAAMDGVTFRPAGPATKSSGEPLELESLDQLRDLLD